MTIIDILRYIVQLVLFFVRVAMLHAYHMPGVPRKSVHRFIALCVHS